MALSINECKRQDTLSKLQAISGCPFPVGYARFADERIHYGDPSWTCCVDMYFDEQARIDNPGVAHHYFLGGNLTDADFPELASKDNRDLLYRHAEYLIHYIYATQIKSKDGFDAQKTNTELEELREALGIETIFHPEFE